MAAPAEPPYVDLDLDWCTRRARLLAWVRYADGTWHGRVAFGDLVGDEVVTVEVTLPAASIIELPGVDYGHVPVERVAPRVTGRVATGHEWRRTG